ncbi:hypothetical protein FRC10_007681 [Ceratobasidium sp. 414]|nr:hypothetical protein FRC10_007681 [Ceratobasidium sp. 414]
MAFEAVRARMWRNRVPGETRVQLDYSEIISAYGESLTSPVEGRQGIPRSYHRLVMISLRDKKRIRAEVRDVMKRGGPTSGVNWPTLFQTVLDRYASHLEDPRCILCRSDTGPVEVVAAARHKLLVMLSPYMVLPQAKSWGVEPDDDRSERIYQACATHATAGIPGRGNFTKQLLARSIDRVQNEICSSLAGMWATALDSEGGAVFAEKMEAEGFM